MTQLLKLNLAKWEALKARRAASLLGLTLDGSRLEGVVLRRTNGSLEVQHSFSASLSLDPLTSASELVGREIRNHLNAAGVRERHCVVGVPLTWALTMQVKLPDLDEADVTNFLNLEAERGFPSDVATLIVAKSIYQTAAGEKFATLVGVPRNHLDLLEQVLVAAQLKPVSLALGIVALQPATDESSNGVLTLAIGESHVGLLVTAGGGVAALRALEGAFETEGAQSVLQVEHVARDARITLGQLPAEVREAVRRVRVFGPREQADDLADEIQERLGSLGLSVEVVSAYAPGQFGVGLPAGVAVSPAFSVAAATMTGRKPVFELLAPKVTAFQQLAARYSSGKLQKIGVAVGVALLMMLGGFAVQQWQLWRLRSEWSRIGSKVRELEALQAQVRQFRPWFDESYRSLSIMRAVTAAFPEDGVVSAKTIEIRDPNIVTCTGVARDNQSLLKTLERLRKAGGVADVKVDMIRGKSPMQFTFDFHWVEGGQNEH
jgi:hypothetical protein